MTANANATFNPVINTIISLVLRYILRSFLIPFYMAYGVTIIVFLFSFFSLFRGMGNDTIAIYGIAIAIAVLFAPSILMDSGINGFIHGNLSFDGNDLIYSIGIWYVFINVISDIIRYVRRRSLKVEAGGFKTRHHLLIFAILWGVTGIAMHLFSGGESLGVALMAFLFCAFTLIPYKIYLILTRAVWRMPQM